MIRKRSVPHRVRVRLFNQIDKVTRKLWEELPIAVRDSVGWKGCKGIAVEIMRELNR